MAEQKRASDEANALTKIGHWPVVSDSWDKLSTLYTRTKESNRLVNFTFGTAEAGLKAAVNLATPVATTVLGKPSEFTSKIVVKPRVKLFTFLFNIELVSINKYFCVVVHAINDMTCRQLDKLERSYPIVTKPTNQVA